MIGISPVFPASTCQLLLTGAGSECCERDDHKFWMTYCASFVPSLVSIRDGTRRSLDGIHEPHPPMWDQGPPWAAVHA
jgi:hypothetical protein